MQPTSEAPNATLTRRREIGGRFAIIVVRPDEPLPPFEPGQYITLGLPRGDEEPHVGDLPDLMRRPFSIASSPENHEEIELFIERFPGGHFSESLWQLAPGDRLWLDPEIKGTLTPERAPEGADALMVGTSTGVAPFVSMLRTDQAASRFNRMVILHGVEDIQQTGYREEIQRLADDASVKYIPIVAHRAAETAWEEVRQAVDAVIGPQPDARAMDVKLDPQRTHVFLAGDPRMIDAVRHDLEEAGFRFDENDRDGNVHYERYWPEGHEPGS